MIDENREPNFSRERVDSSKPKNRRFVATMAGLTAAALLILIVLVFFSDFPGQTMR